MEQIIDTTPITIATNEIVINNTTTGTVTDIDKNNIADNNTIDADIQDTQMNVQDIQDDTPDLEEMEFKPIHTILEYKNKEGKTKRVKIYNVDDEKNTELMKIAMKYSTITEDGQVNTNIPSTVVLLDVMRILTNIKFPNNEEVINRIIIKPDDYLKKTLLIVSNIFKDMLEINFKSLELTKDALEKFGLDEEKMNKMIEKHQEIKKLEVDLEKEKQITLQEKAKTNDELVKELLGKINKLEVEKLEVMAENEKLKAPKEKRKYTRKNKKNEEVIKAKEGEISNG